MQILVFLISPPPETVTGWFDLFQSSMLIGLLNLDLLLMVDQVGKAACHTGYRSCFYRKVSGGREEIVGELIFNPKDVYK